VEDLFKKISAGRARAAEKTTAMGVPRLSTN
jgi:hypothetical protein